MNLSSIVGTKEAADFFGMSTQAFLNYKNRNEEKGFPKPVKTLKATPIYDMEELQKWAEEHQLNYHSKEVIQINGQSCKTIAFCGRPRVGKSWIISLFAENSILYRSGCSKGGSDFTQCSVQNIFRNDIMEEHVVFHISPNNVGSRILDDEKMDGRECPFEEGKLEIFMEEINLYLREKIQKNEISNNEAYLEFYLRPSSLAKNIMKENGLNTLKIIDTPGVSNNYKLVQVDNADLVFIVLSDSNETEAINSFTDLVKGIAPLVASNKGGFLYRLNEACDDEEEYEELQKQANQAMSCFTECFSDLKGSIIESSMDVLQPEKSVIGIPSMKTKKISVSENIFTKKFEEKINSLLRKSDVDIEELRKTILENNVDPNEAKELVLKLLESWSAQHWNQNKEGKYTDKEFKEEAHDRVMTSDQYRMIHFSTISRQKQLQELFEEFKQHTVDSYQKNWQQELIKYVYQVVTLAIKNDVGIADGNHPLEQNPPITMHAIEAVLAEHILNEVIDGKNKIPFRSYVDLMNQYGVTSNSWSYINVNVNDDNKTKLVRAIVNSKLSKVKCDSLEDCIRTRYTLGLQMLGQHEILQNLSSIYNMNEEDAAKYCLE